MHVGARLLRRSRLFHKRRLQVRDPMRIVLASTIRARLVGLIGKRDFDGVLALVPCNDIHTFAMQRALDIAFVAPDGTVIEAHRAVPPNRRLRNRKATATLERFANDGKWYVPGDCIEIIKGDSPL